MYQAPSQRWLALQKYSPCSPGFKSDSSSEALPERLENRETSPRVGGVKISRLGWFVLNVVRNESLAKFRECLFFERAPDLARQIKIEMQIVSGNQPKPENLPGLDEMPYVTPRKRSAC